MSDYKDVFGREPEAWRTPLGALRLTLWDDSKPEWQLQRARDEVEWLTRVLNEADGPNYPVPMLEMGLEK